MSETVIADFVGHFAMEHTGETPVRGRVLLSRKRLVLAGEDERFTIPLSSVVDVAVGHVPPDLEGFFDDSVTVAYERAGRHRVAVVQGGSDTIEKFTAVLFRALLRGTEVVVVHPTRVGGRVKDTDPARAALRLGGGAIRFEGPNAFTVDLSAVSAFRRTTRTVADGERPALEVRHLSGGNSVYSVAAMSDQRKLNLLGRFLRREYDEVRRDLTDVDLSEEQVRALITLYSAGGRADLTSMLEEDPRRVNMLLNGLKELGMVSDGSEGTELTSKGRIVVSTRLESVNR